MHTVLKKKPIKCCIQLLQRREHPGLIGVRGEKRMSKAKRVPKNPQKTTHSTWKKKLLGVFWGFGFAFQFFKLLQAVLQSRNSEGHRITEFRSNLWGSSCSNLLSSRTSCSPGMLAPEPLWLPCSSINYLYSKSGCFFCWRGISSIIFSSLPLVLQLDTTEETLALFNLLSSIRYLYNFVRFPLSSLD